MEVILNCTSEESVFGVVPCNTLPEEKGESRVTREFSLSFEGTPLSEVVSSSIHSGGIALQAKNESGGKNTSLKRWSC